MIRNFIITLLAGLLVCPILLPGRAEACDVAVISGKVTTNGRPVIWKNRDHSANWVQQIQYYDAGSGALYASVRVTDESDIPSGGVNDAGFAIANTTVYELNPAHELLNACHYLTIQALEECATVADFDRIIDQWDEDPFNDDKIISGNFVVIDAEGGAVLYEIFSGHDLNVFGEPLMVRKTDANTGRITDENGTVLDPGAGDDFIGFVNRTNSHTWRDILSDDFRQVRGTQILTELAEQGKLNYRNVMRYLSKDVCGDRPKPATLQTFDTMDCISRYQTNLALVVDGVASGDDPRLAVFWCILGEPSVGVATPHFAAAGKVTPYAWAEVLDGDRFTEGILWEGRYYTDKSSLLNLGIDKCERSMYTNNWDEYVPVIQMDRSINYMKLLIVQNTFTFQIEDMLVGKMDNFIEDMQSDASRITPANLYTMSHYSSKYAYDNYKNNYEAYRQFLVSRNAYDPITETRNLTGWEDELHNVSSAWTLKKPWGGSWVADPDTGGGLDDLENGISGKDAGGCGQALNAGVYGANSRGPKIPGMLNLFSAIFFPFLLLFAARYFGNARRR